MSPSEAYLEVISDPKYARIFLKTYGSTEVQSDIGLLPDQEAVYQALLLFRQIERAGGWN